MSSAERPGLLISMVRWIGSWAVTIPLVGLTMIVWPFSRAAAHRLGQRWARAQLKIFGVDATIEHLGDGRYDRPPYLFTLMNQTSLAEGLAVPLAIPIPHVAFTNLEFVLIPVLGWASLLGGVLVVKQWPAQRKKAGLRATEKVRGGSSFYISIEGNRSATGELQPYKKGPVVMAINAGASIVPMYFFGARERLPRGEWRVRPGPMRVVMGAPVDLRGRSISERDQIIEELRAETVRQLANSGDGKHPPV
jgi:1-acyl-sn-glycerol-3-phosphate acyltransferase